MAVNMTSDFQKTPDLNIVYVGRSRAAYLGDRLILEPHANAVCTLALSLDTPFTLTRYLTDALQVSTQQFAVIEANTLHHISSQGKMLFLYLDPCEQSKIDIEQVDLDQVIHQIRHQPTLGLDNICDALNIQSYPLKDQRLMRVIQQLQQHPDLFLNIEDAAQMAHLSASRFRALFMQQMGLPFRRYRLWHKMAMCMMALAQGQTLTQSAHQAGFASSAHFCSAFKKMFGLQPSQLIKNTQIQISPERILT